MKCRLGHEVKAVRSAAGFYIGTQHDGEPMCKLSEEYWKTEAEALEHLKNATYRTRQAVEIVWCCGGGGK